MKVNILTLPFFLYRAESHGVTDRYDPISEKDISFLGELVLYEIILRCRRILHACKELDSSMPIIELTTQNIPSWSQ